jgi:PAS domain S-box-containing protein
MAGLILIKDTVMQVAEAITSALEIETEIIDNRLMIIGGSGRYVKKVGSFEEDGNVNSGLIYSKLLKSGENYICYNPKDDLTYKPQEGELAEICCPIKSGDKILGLIGLVAFDQEQRNKIMKNSITLTIFLARMAELIASKLEQTISSNQIKSIVESMHEGLLAIDKDFNIVSCNYKCENLLGLKRGEIEGNKISTVWDIEGLDKVVTNGEIIKDKEIAYINLKNPKNLEEKRFLCSLIPINDSLKPEEKSLISGAMILFQDISDARERIYKMASTAADTTIDHILGESEAILNVKRRAIQVATSDSTILITGESGTGKELFARAIHFASPRKDNAFISINCGAIPDMLLESELFGYERGAFTGADKSGKPGKFEIAHHGTIFLDEIGDLPVHLQVKLLHAIQNRQIDRIGGVKPIDIDVRIIAATNKNLEEMIKEKQFREDLYFRLNVIPLVIPPLRERGHDTQLLLDFALKKFTKLLNKCIESFSEDAINALLKYNWPGNVRELENVVEYAVNMENSDKIIFGNLPDRIQRTLSEKIKESSLLRDRMDEYQKKIIEETLAQTGKSLEGKLIGAKLLGISESTLYRRLRELNIKE